MNFGYARVSSKDQKLDRQLEALAGVKLDEVYEEKISGKDTDRPELQRMLSRLRAGDVIYIKSLDRLARSFKAFLSIWEQIESAGAALHVIDMGLRLDDKPITKFYVTVMVAVAELERGMIRERQREGIALAKERGEYKRQPAKTVLDRQSQIMTLREKGLTTGQIASIVGCDVRTVQRAASRAAKSEK